MYVGEYIFFLKVLNIQRAKGEQEKKRVGN